MSQLEVDKIIPQSGTTLTIGDSGDTITFGTGTTPQLGGDLDLNSNDITGTGNINITGTVVSDGLTVDGGTGTLRLGTGNTVLGDGDVIGKLEFYSSDASTNSSGVTFEITNISNDNNWNGTDNRHSTYFISYGDASTPVGTDSGKTRLSIDNATGDISFYEDTGTTPKLFWDASAESLGIGTSSPAKQLDISGNNGGGGQTNTLRFTDTDTNVAANQTSGRIEFFTSDTTSAGVGSAITGLSGTGGTASSKLAFEVAGSEAMRIDSSGNVGIGTSSPSVDLHIHTSAVGASSEILLTNGDTGSTSTDGFKIALNTGAGGEIWNYENDYIRFGTNNSERMRIHSSGDVLVGKTANDENTNGIRLSSVGLANFARDSGGVLTINRNGTDGTVVDIRGQGTTEGTIQISGATVSYNGFTGTHWSRLSDNSKPTILKGTILESLDEMMDWYQVQFDVTKTDDEGNETTITKKESYALGDGESVGDVITYNYEGTDYQATIIQEGDIKHTKSKISDTVDAKNVYGVFVDWDNDDDTVNDMYVAQTGTFVVRINSSETVSKGDLIQSNGDGTGKVQADDLLRASTVAKVLSTTKIETYDDGSYIVPCSLHC